MRDRVLNATAASLLGFLHEGPMSGWDLVAMAEERIGRFWSLTRSQVYRELDALTEAGYVEPEARGRRDRRPFGLTIAGREAFAAWIDRAPGDETIRYPLLLTLQFGRHLSPGRLTDFLAAHRRAHADQLAGYQRELVVGKPSVEDGDPYRLATLLFGLAYERAVVAWFDELPAVIGALP